VRDHSRRPNRFRLTVYCLSTDVKSHMVSIAVSKVEYTELIFVQADAKADDVYHRDVVGPMLL